MRPAVARASLPPGAGDRLSSPGGLVLKIVNTTLETLYCNKPHRLSDGQPVGHRCRVLPPEILKAEQEGDIERVAEFFTDPTTKLVISNGVEG